MASAATEQDNMVDQQLGRDMGLTSDEHDIALEPEPAPFNKCFVLSAIVVFLAIGCSSVPNLLSARNPREGVRTTSIPAEHKNYRSEALAYREALARHSSDGVDGVITRGTGADVQEHKRASNLWDQMADRALGNEHEDVERKHHNRPGSGLPSTRRNSQAQASSSPSTSPAVHVSTPAAGSQQGQFLRTSPPPRIQEANIWPLIQGFIWLVLRGSLWSMRTSFRLARLVVSKPVNVFVAVAEPPYTIVRDMCRAFLPVYSFFAVAAVVGVVVGGSATWIAQQLIAALGADKENGSLNRSTDTVLVGPAHASTSSHGRPVFVYEADSFTVSDEEFRSATSARRAPAQLGKTAAARMPETPSHHKRGPTMTEVEDDYGDDDDDDDDDDEDEGDGREGGWHGR